MEIRDVSRGIKIYSWPDQVGVMYNEKGIKMNQFAEDCIEWVIMELEGGNKYVNDPRDPGGETKYGISKRFHPDESIRTLTLVRAKGIYYNHYFSPAGIGKISSMDIAKRVLGFVVHIGSSRAIKVLQSSLRATGRILKADGVLGPLTTGAVNDTPPEILVPVFREAMAGWYRLTQSDDVFLPGYLNRAYK